jgi:hypothetical protein
MCLLIILLLVNEKPVNLMGPAFTNNGDADDPAILFNQ